MQNIIPSSIGALIVAAIAAFLGISQVVLSAKTKNAPWYKWGCAISFIVFFQGMAVFLQFNLDANLLNQICEHIQISCFVLLVYACYEFTIHYLGVKPVTQKRKIVQLNYLLLLLVWWPGLIIKHEFIYRNFLWLSQPYIEPPLTLLGKGMVICLGVLGLYIVKMWYHKKESTGSERWWFLSGFGIWYLFCIHDLICALGFESVHYLSVYGYFGFLMAIVGVITIKHMNMVKEIELSARALEVSKNELELKVQDRTQELLAGNQNLQTVVDRLTNSEKRLSILSSQTEQFSLAAASMLLIGDEKLFFNTVCDAIVKYSDYKRVLISIFKASSPFRDIIGYGGLETDIIDRLRKVEMPASQYDHVFQQGEKVGRQSYYVPYTMKEILKQEATVYGKGSLSDKEDAWHPEDNLFVKMMNEKGAFIGVISVDESKSGLRPTDETVRPLEIFSSLISQIIVFKKEQIKIQKLEEQLMQARRMESIGTLTGGIAHDFNNILGVIVGTTELAMEKLSKTDKLYSDLESIHYAGNKAADIVKQLLSFGKKSEMNLKPVLVDAILDDLLRLLKSTIPATVEVITQFKTERSVIMADSVQINQVFLNLCLNAVQSMENRDGVIKLICEPVFLAEDNSHKFPELKLGNHIKITVSDSGEGIHPDILDRIFDPYFTTKDIGKGSGIGLAVVHGIVKHHNGAVMVKSCQGEGTTFDVLFPLVEMEPENIEVKEEAAEMGDQESVLLVDDDQMILDLMGRSLEWLGYNVIGVLEPEEALKIFKAHPQAFDLVITDMTMPCMSGLVLTQKILDIDPQKPIIICTGYNDMINGKTAQDLKVSGLLMKPVRVGALANEVKRALKRSHG
ncbi:MAG: response regulator [Proteobacteria bacterium]|nr:response regulator [Pseudomonadota bacterium]MBU1585059.1 response regulator [Pseudomonadota bacterium]MBU2456017.1 response regulator [Pseudomonadota bacterium]MBU2627353.1 response regulator [Pseudomonadota bacterium]